MSKNGHEKAEQVNEDGPDEPSREEDQPKQCVESGKKVLANSPLRHLKRDSEEDVGRIEEERRELTAQLQDEYGEIRWSGPVRLGRRAGILLTFDCGLAVIRAEEDGQQAGFLPAEEIASLSSRVRGRAVEIRLNGPAEIAPGGTLLIHGGDDRLFYALATIPRPTPARSIEQTQPIVRRLPASTLRRAEPSSSDGLGDPGEQAASDRGWTGSPPRSAGRGQSGLLDSRRSADRQGLSAGTRRSEPAKRRDRAEQEPEGEVGVAARVATAFSPTAYVELLDGVLRPCAWGGTGEPPAVNAVVELCEGASGWVAMSMREGASVS